MLGLFINHNKIQFFSTHERKTSDFLRELFCSLVFPLLGNAFKSPVSFAAHISQLSITVTDRRQSPCKEESLGDSGRGRLVLLLWTAVTRGVTGNVYWREPVYLMVKSEKRRRPLFHSPLQRHTASDLKPPTRLQPLQVSASSR